MTDSKLLFTGPDHKDNWFYNRYFYSGCNFRYHTFQLALNLLNQLTSDPLIVETGCQREEEDLGAGMSTSIFAEYISRYGGRLITCDINLEHLRRAHFCCQKWPNAKVDFVANDSVFFLENLKESADLYYLDSLDYPVGDQEGDIVMQQAAQNHCLKEFQAIEKLCKKNCLLLLDDNQLPGGGKPAKAKDYLLQSGEWILLLDLQSSLWIKE